MTTTMTEKDIVDKLQTLGFELKDGMFRRGALTANESFHTDGWELKVGDSLSYFDSAQEMIEIVSCLLGIGEFESWEMAACHIPSNGRWVPKIVYRMNGHWSWRDAAAPEGEHSARWSGGHVNRNHAAQAACHHYDFEPEVKPGEEFHNRLEDQDIG
jgi:hypothetical protein